MPNTPVISTILFDYGGVLAEEGFTQGLSVIARENGLDPSLFVRTATEIIYDCGYVTGKNTEHAYWELLRSQTGITAEDQPLTEAILSRFTLRPNMLVAVRTLKKQGVTPVILSDQTDWLDRLNQRQPFFQEFTRVFNSYHLGKTKREPSLFTDILSVLQVEAGQTLFVDDNPGHIDRATALGLQTHLFRNEELFFADLARRGLA
ncbi:MAG: HAD family phosphatase [Desulfurivibrio sp.]|nr:HAD family phosphatase [Desulfurivibrio sp.]MBU3936777.1 HAD family phosphatase [Pseudomonadota bacterium]MBU4033995.1 HAD family phosphatase [Pseudomonadota bacterium]MBU4117274.1 HAD family phosphatase [Pseudomonadota bacterium]